MSAPGLGFSPVGIMDTKDPIANKKRPLMRRHVMPNLYARAGSTHDLSSQHRSLSALPVAAGDAPSDGSSFLGYAVVIALVVAGVYAIANA